MAQAQDGTQPKPPVRGAHTFNLSAELDAFTDYVLKRVTPVYASHYVDQISRQWEKISERFSNKTPATQKLYVSKFRKALELALTSEEPNADRRAGIMTRLKAIVRNDPAIVELVNETYSAKVVENTRKLVFVANYQKIVSLARGWLSSEDEARVAIGLMLLTGRRFYEVLVAGIFTPTFERIDGKRLKGRVMSKWEVTFLGQLKTREADGTQFGQSFSIPLLAPVNEVLPAIEWLRRSPLGSFAAQVTQDAANSNINPRLNRELRRSELAQLWPDNDPDFSLKSTRALYAEICYKHHAPAGIHKDTYFAQILGHREGDLRTALSYVRYYLDEKDDAAARAELIRIASESERQAKAYREQREADTSGFTSLDRVKLNQVSTRATREMAVPGDVSRDAIRNRLRLKGLELGEFAKSIGRHRTTIWRNLAASGNEEIHQSIAKALGVKPSDIWPSRYAK